jgi:phage major head subunit gpT-like protein
MLYSANAIEKAILATLITTEQAESDSLISLLCERVPSTSDKEKHEYLGPAPQMEEFRGSRNYSAMTSAGFEIENKVFSSGLQIEKDLMRRNRSGSIGRRISTWVQKCQRSKVKRLIADTIVVGDVAGNTAYDGAVYFADSHPARKNEGGAQDNKLAQTGTSVSQIQTDIQEVFEYFAGVKDEESDPFHGDGENLDVLILCGPAIRSNMRTALLSDLISNTTNMEKGRADLRVTGRITGDTWYGFVTNPGRKPFIYQPEVSLMVEDPVYSQEERAWKYAVEEVSGLGYGFWQSAVQVGS